MMTLGISLAGSVAALRTFLPEKAVYFRESAAGGYTVAYFLAKSTFKLCMYLVQIINEFSFSYFDIA